MVRKLEQNYIWAHVLRPIVKDLKFIMRLTRKIKYKNLNDIILPVNKKIVNFNNIL